MEKRILRLCTYLLEGKSISKEETARDYNVSIRTIQRDIEDLREYFEDEMPFSGVRRSIIYDKEKKEYRLEPPINALLTNSEIFTVVKILLEGRSLSKAELNPIIAKLVQCVYPVKERQVVDQLLKNEEFYYVEPKHGQPLLSKIWQLGQDVHNCQVLKISYERHSDGKVVERIIQPVGIMCSEYYFYLLAYYDEEDELIKSGEVEYRKYPNTFRIDRLRSFAPDGERKFKVPYADRFQEGEFRKRVQFMFNGELRTLKFWCSKLSLEAVEDRLPTAKIVEEDKDGKGYILTAEVYGKGVDMWLRSQGDAVKMLSVKAK
jgi:predicted DNA-binding transcriptional regulator YafY